MRRWLIELSTETPGGICLHHCVAMGAEAAVSAALRAHPGRSVVAVWDHDGVPVRLAPRPRVDGVPPGTAVAPAQGA